MNSVLGGNRTYIDDPISIIKFWDGGISGLHFFGGLLFGAIALLLFLRRRKMDIWLFLDAIAPAALIGQAIARPANFINQELYGPPTQLPWGIPIDAEHRLAQYSDFSLYPVETARFHPTFAYEMIWNFLAALFLLWYARERKQSIKPGTIFGAWLIAAGVGRVIVEFFRPDQPKIPGTIFSYSALVSALMAIAGVIFLLVRYGKFKAAFAEGWEEEYQIAEPKQEEKKPRTRKVAEVSVEDEAGEEELVTPPKRSVRRTASTKK
jgi:phosphatidylglycerol:prolipoprotein diacylglycerol transferase